MKDRSKGPFGYRQKTCEECCKNINLDDEEFYFQMHGQSNYRVYTVSEHERYWYCSQKCFDKANERIKENA